MAEIRACRPGPGEGRGELRRVRCVHHDGYAVTHICVWGSREVRDSRRRVARGHELTETFQGHGGQAGVRAQVRKELCHHGERAGDVLKGKPSVHEPLGHGGAVGGKLTQTTKGFLEHDSGAGLRGGLKDRARGGVGHAGTRGACRATVLMGGDGGHTRLAVMLRT